MYGIIFVSIVILGASQHIHNTIFPVNSYEGTGRSLSLKLLQQLRVQAGQAGTAVVASSSAEAAAPSSKDCQGW